MSRKKPKEGTKAEGAWLKQRLARRCLRLWTEVVKTRAGGFCEACGQENGRKNEKGRPQWLNAHHIEDKMNWATRFDPENGIMLCPGHHKYFPNSAHRSALWIVRLLKRKRGLEIVRSLFRKRKIKERQTSAGWSVAMLQEQAEALEAVISKMKGE